MVILTLIDGLRPDALAAAQTPHLDAFRRRSAYTMQASSLMPTITLPCHMTIFYSVPAGRHGILTNTFSPLARPLPSLVDHATQERRRCAFITSWDGFSALYQPSTLDFNFSVHYVDEHGRPRLEVDEQVAEAAARYLPRLQPDFAFVYFGTTDAAGHEFGWMDDRYLRQVERVDGWFGQMLAALPEDSHMIVQSDHGGHDRTHGSDRPEDMEIPWLIAGPGIKADYEIRQPVNLLHTAPTIAHLLGIEPHRAWEGDVVREIFT